MSTRELIEGYYHSIKSKNDRWQGMYSPDAIFSDASLTLHAEGKQAVLQSFIPFLKGVEDVNVSQMIVENDYACAIVDYVYTNPKGQHMNQAVAEIWQVKNGQLYRLTIYFDLTAYRSFMRG